MITKTRTKNSDLKQTLGIKIMPNNTISNKKLLLKIAKSLKPRPKKETKLGQALNSYTNKNHTSYDEVFTKKVKELSPYWFRETKIAAIKKDLIDLAKSGDDKPSKKTRLGNWLAVITNESSDHYDKKFFNLIKNTRPDWFVVKTIIKNTKEEDRGSTFLSKFKFLNFLVKRGYKEIYSKQKLSELYFRSSNEKYLKASQRLAKCFQKAGLLVLCDEKGMPRFKSDPTKKSYWKLPKDIFNKLGFEQNDYKK